jgi:hypothetical protein
MSEILELELCDNDALRITGKLKFCGAPRSPLIDTCSIKLIMESASQFLLYSMRLGRT